MGRKLLKDHKMSNAEIKRRQNDKECSIDNEIEQGYSEIDWSRRNAAELNLVQFTKTYLIGLALDEPPSVRGEEVLMQMDKAIREHSNYAIALHRGAGKSAFCICAAVYALVTGLQKFVVIIANNARAANGLLNDIWKVFSEPDSALAKDYPSVFIPYNISQGSYRRRYLVKGVPVEIKKTANELVLPTYKDPRFKAASGSLVVTRSITGGLRGIRHGTLRPSMVFLDDLQTSETAKSQEAVQKLMETIQGDIIPLAGKSRLSILQTFTPIYPDDVVQKIREDPNWTTTVYPAIISMPTNTELWNEYFKMYNEESVAEAGHAASLEFYRNHFDEMNAGSEVFNPARYSEKDGHISMLQKLLEIKNQIGEQAWSAEYMMNPKALQFALPITPKIVASRVSSLKELEIPADGVQYICAATDVNPSKYLTTVIMAFTRKQTAHIIYHKFRKCRIPANIPEHDYYQRLYNLLGEHGRELKNIADEHGFKIQGWSIDCGGTNWNPVLDFAKNSIRICGLPCCGFAGKASHAYRSFMRSRLKEDVNRTLLCGDEDERKKSGSGRRWTYFDSDGFHEQTQKGFLQEVGNIGSISWYQGGNHTDWAVQVCNEKLLLKRARQDGTVEYTWKEIGEDHDALDSIGQCLATYASQGFANGTTGKSAVFASRQRFIKRKIRLT